MGFVDRVRSLFGESKLDVSKRFELMREAVSGTMSKFYMAKDRDTGDVVGLKVCDLEKTNFFEGRFAGLKKPSEGEIASQFDHPRIVKTLEYGTTVKDEHYVVMEFLDGSHTGTGGLHPAAQPPNRWKQVSLDPANGRSVGRGAREKLHPPRRLPTKFYLHQERQFLEADRLWIDGSRGARLHAAGESDRDAKLHGPGNHP